MVYLSALSEAWSPVAQGRESEYGCRGRSMAHFAITEPPIHSNRSICLLERRMEAEKYLFSQDATWNEVDMCCWQSISGSTECRIYHGNRTVILNGLLPQFLVIQYFYLFRCLVSLGFLGVTVILNPIFFLLKNVSPAFVLVESKIKFLSTVSHNFRKLNISLRHNNGNLFSL